MNLINEEKIKYILLSIIIFLELIIIGIEVMCIECEDEVVKSKNDVAIVEVQKNQKGEVSEKNVSKIKVDIKGAVKKEGVYELDSGSRVIDVVNLAGGLKSNASTKYLNLSKLLSDEMIVNVFTTSQVKSMSVKEEIKEECICPVLDCSKCFNSTIIDGNSNNDLVPDQNIESNNKISLNNSTKEELMTLTGVGESKAEAIIEYRNKNNGFKNIEEIMNVSGIGEAAYNKIKDNITL